MIKKNNTLFTKMIFAHTKGHHGRANKVELKRIPQRPEG